MKLLAHEELEEAKRWIDMKLPKSACMSIWFSVRKNLDSRGVETPENDACYVDRWPNPRVMAGVDQSSFLCCIFADVQSEQSEIVEQFLIDLADAIGATRLGSVDLYSLDDLKSAFERVFVNRFHFQTKPMPSLRGYWMTQEACDRLRNRSIEAPAGFEFDSLKLDDAEYVDETWPHRFPGSLKFVQDRIRYFPSVCLRESSGEKRLASFEIVHSTGTMTHLYTAQEFRRRGLATLVELKLAQLFIERNHIPVKMVVPGNIEGEKVTEVSPWWNYICDLSWLNFTKD